MALAGSTFFFGKLILHLFEFQFEISYFHCVRILLIAPRRQCHLWAMGSFWVLLTCCCLISPLGICHLFSLVSGANFVFFFNPNTGSRLDASSIVQLNHGKIFQTAD